MRWNVVGEQLLTRCTTPCCLKNATGIVTGVATDRGVSVIRPKYWPLASPGALMTTLNRAVPLRRTLMSRPLLTVIVAPDGATVETARLWSAPETLVILRLVKTVPGIVGAS